MSPVAILVGSLLAGGVVALAVGAGLMDVASTAAWVLTRVGIAALVVGVAVAVIHTVTV